MAHPAATATIAPQRRVSSLSEAQALGWFARLNAADLTDSDRMAFNRWLALHPSNRENYRSVLALWARLAPGTQRPAQDR
ncbi:MAG: FecR/PupR family sigma factor regulator [Pseudomonadota bacterium]